MALPKERIYTIADIYALPEGRRAELIDGRMYMMAPPNTVHQRIVMNLSAEIRDYIRKKRGACEVFPAPFAVFLNQDDKNYVEPDISVICDKQKLTEKGCQGSPDWVIEIVSPGTKHMDYGIKLFKYRNSGVREYWIINPVTGTVNAYDFEHDRGTSQYGFDEEITGCIFEDFIIRGSELMK